MLQHLPKHWCISFPKDTLKTEDQHGPLNPLLCRGKQSFIVFHRATQGAIVSILLGCCSRAWQAAPPETCSLPLKNKFIFQRWWMLPSLRWFYISLSLTNQQKSLVLSCLCVSCVIVIPFTFLCHFLQTHTTYYYKYCLPKSTCCTYCTYWLQRGLGVERGGHRRVLCGEHPHEVLEAHQAVAILVHTSGDPSTIRSGWPQRLDGGILRLERGLAVGEQPSSRRMDVENTYT